MAEAVSSVAERGPRPPSAPQPGTGFIRRVVEHLRAPMHRNAYALVASGLLTSSLGLVYWLLVAHRYRTEDVGVGSAAVSAMTLLANAGGLGLQNGFVRFIPSAGKNTGRFVRQSIVVAASTGAVLAAIFVIGLRWWAPRLSPLLLSSPLAALGFIGATVVWVVFVLQDNALIGLRRATYIPIENLGFSVLKIGFMIGLAASVPLWGVFGSWAAAALVGVVGVSGFVLPRLLREADLLSTRDDLPPAGQLRRYLAAEHVSILLWMATVETIPLLVLHRLGAAPNAYYTLSAQIAYALMLLPSSVSVALTAESAGNPVLLEQHLRRAARNTAVLLLPAVALVVAFAPIGLRAFGKEYSAQASSMLRLMALSSVPYALTVLMLGVARVQRRIRSVALISLGLCALVAGLAQILMGRYGLVGIGAAWLIAQLIVAAGVAVTQLHRVGIRILDDRLLRFVAAPRAHHRRRAAARRIRPLVARITVLGTVRSSEVVAARNDVVVALVRSKEHGARVLKIAHRDGADRSLQHSAAAMASVRARVPAIAGYIPVLFRQGTVDGHTYLLEEYRSGATGAERLADQRLSFRSLAQSLEMLGELHGETASAVVIDEAWMRNWVRSPLARVRHVAATPTAIRAVDVVRERLESELRHRRVTVSTIHGDVAPGNLLFDQETGDLAAVLDWEASASDGLPELDIVQLLFALGVAQHGVELDDAVPRLLSGDAWTVRDRALWQEARRSRPNEDLSLWTLVALAWLAHVDANIVKAEWYSKSTRWVERNVDHVLLHLAELGPSPVTPARAVVATHGFETIKASGAIARHSGPDTRSAASGPAATSAAGAGRLLGSRAGLGPEVVERPSTRLLRRPMVTIGVAALLWLVGVHGIDLRAMSDLGLLSVLRPTAYVALGVLVVGVVANLAGRAVSGRGAAANLVAALAMVHGTPAVIYAGLRYSWAWKHVGIVDYVLRTKGVDPSIGRLAIYHQWPGFFSAAAFLTKAFGADNALTIASWAPLAFNLLNLLVLVFLFSALTDDRRVVWLAALLFFVTNWVGQDYFSPQALAFALHLGVIGLALHRFPFQQRDTVGRSWRAPATTLVALLGVVAIATSHQLTPVMSTLSLIAVALLRRARVWRLAILSGVVNLVWGLTYARRFMSGQVDALRARFGQVGANASGTFADTSLQSSGQALVSSVGRAGFVIIALLAAVGFVRAWRLGRREWTPAILAGVPAGALLLNDYGGEIVFRVVLFASPFLAFLAAGALVPGPGRPWSARRSVATIAAVGVLLTCFLFGYYGKDRQYSFSADEIAASGYVAAHAGPSTLLVTLNSNYPNLIEGYERFTTVQIQAEPEASRSRVLDDPATTLAGWLADPRYTTTFLLVTRSQLLEIADTGDLPIADARRLADVLHGTATFERVFDTPDATVYRLANRPQTSEEAP